MPCRARSRKGLGSPQFRISGCFASRCRLFQDFGPPHRTSYLSISNHVPSPKYPQIESMKPVGSSSPLYLRGQMDARRQCDARYMGRVAMVDDRVICANRGSQPLRGSTGCARPSGCALRLDKLQDILWKRTRIAKMRKQGLRHETPFFLDLPRRQ